MLLLKILVYTAPPPHHNLKVLAKANYEKHINCAMADMEVQWGHERIKALNLDNN